MNSLTDQGRWRDEAAIEEAVAADVITAALFTRLSEPRKACKKWGLYNYSN